MSKDEELRTLVTKKGHRILELFDTSYSGEKLERTVHTDSRKSDITEKMRNLSVYL